MDIAKIFNDVRASFRALNEDGTPSKALPTDALIAHCNALHADWQHLDLPVLEKTQTVVLEESDAGVLREFRKVLDISRILWVNDERGTLPAYYTNTNSPNSDYDAGFAAPEGRFLVVNGDNIHFHGTSRVEIRGYQNIPRLIEADLETYDNILLRVHPNLYYTGIAYKEAIAVQDTETVRLQHFTTAYNEALKTASQTVTMQSTPAP